MSETGTERCHGCSDLLTEENRGPDPLFCRYCVPYRKSDLKPGYLAFVCDWPKLRSVRRRKGNEDQAQDEG